MNRKKPDRSLAAFPGSRPIALEILAKVPNCLFCEAHRDHLRLMQVGEYYYVACSKCLGAGPKTAKRPWDAIQLYLVPFKRIDSDKHIADSNGYSRGRSESYHLREGLRDFAKMLRDLADEPEED